MNCWHCETELIWGGDHDGEDYCNEEYNIVTNLSCPKCDAFVLVYHSPKNNWSEKDEILELDDYYGCREDDGLIYEDNYYGDT